MYRFLPVVVVLLCLSPALAHNVEPTSSSTAWTKGYTLVLVDADTPEELTAARDFIVAKGGTVAIVLPPRAIYGWIPPDVKARILGKHKIRAVHNSVVRAVPTNFRDRETLAAIRLFNDIASGKLARDKERELKNQMAEAPGFSPSRPPMLGCDQPHPQINKADFIRNLQLQGATKSVREAQASVEPNFFDNSNVMDSSVAVGVFLVESNGARDTNVYNWSDADIASTKAQVIDGLNWWVDQSRAFNLSRPLQFTVTFYDPTNAVCQQPYEPILHAGSDAIFWVDAIMNNLGYNSGDTYTKVASFDRNLRDQNHTTWAYSIFIAYNPAPNPTSYTDGRASWAYLGGPFVQLLYRSFGWSVSQLVSHETGHIFYACDEYNQPGYQVCSCSCAPEVRPNAVNGNCEVSSCNISSTACMMHINESALCSFTVAQIGWTSVIVGHLPTAPANLTAAATSPTQINLSWQDTSDNEAGFQIERKGGSDGNFTLLTTTAANTTQYADSTVLANTVYTYRIRAFNNTGASAYSQEITVTTPATPTALTITTTSLPDGTTSVPYSHTVSASGGTPPYQWQIDSGALPPSISFSQFGDLSGTPPTAGTFSFTTRVTDSSSATVNKTLTLVIRAAAPLTITTHDLPRAAAGVAYSQQLGASGGQTPYTWAVQAGSLPQGLNLNPGGTISGTPERAGSSNFTLSLTDATNAVVSVSLSIIVNPATQQLTIDTESLPDGVAGQDYSQTLKGSGGQTPYTWAIRNGQLPAGLTFDSVAGVISGRPTARESQTFDVELSDKSGQIITKQLDIDINPAPELAILTAAKLPSAAVGVPYRVELKATSGTEPYSWLKKKKKKFGTFPDGITLSSDGVLSGTPTAQGSANFTIIVTDAADKQASRPFSMDVGPPPPPLEIRTTTLPNGTLGLPYNATLEAGGGVGPYTWAIDSGLLPAGLTLADTGAITGKPASVSTAFFTIRLRDSLGTSSTRQFSITIVQPPPPLIIQTVSLPDTTAELGYRQTLQATGGVPPYTWSVANGSLGPGLSLSADGIISGTPTTAGTAVFGVRVTDSAQQTATHTLAIKVNPADRVAPFGILETPDHNTTLTANATVTGWALDNVGVVKVEVLVDNQKVGDATYGIARPDVAALYGSFPNSNNAGFSFTLDTTKLTNGVHQLAIRLADLQGNITIVGSRPFQVQNRLLQIVPADVPRGRRGDPYSFQLTASDGHPPYVWTINSGSLPQGLSLSATGLISGTPTVAGTSLFVVRVTDSTNAFAIASYSLLIQFDVEPLQVVSHGDQIPGQTGVDYSNQLFFAGGRPPRTWSLASGQLPPGLSLNPTMGVISGRPTQVGEFFFTVSLTDSTPLTVTSDVIHISITPGPLVITSSGDLAPGTTGSVYNSQLLFLGGKAPVTWSLPAGSSLPPGLSLNATSGVISGTPTQAGAFTFTVKLTDSQNPAVSVTSTSLRIVVTAGTLQITSSGTLTGGKVGQAYTYQLTFSGGAPPVTWSMASGQLPSGLTLNGQTGVISGNPTQQGTFSFTVRLADSTSQSAVSNILRILISP